MRGRKSIKPARDTYVVTTWVPVPYHVVLQADSPEQAVNRVLCNDAEAQWVEPSAAATANALRKSRPTFVELVSKDIDLSDRDVFSRSLADRYDRYDERDQRWHIKRGETDDTDTYQLSPVKEFRS